MAHTAHTAGPRADNIAAVGLVVNTREGMSLAFHYPRDVRKSSELSPTGRGPVDDMFDPDDMFLERLMAEPEDSLARQTFVHKKRSGGNEHQMTDSGAHISPWEQLAGYPTRELAKLLSPGRSYHKKVFQVSLDNLYFVSCPVHVPEGGIWKKKKKPAKSKLPKDGPGDTDGLARTVKDLLFADGETTGEKNADDAAEGGKEKEKEREKDKDKEDKISALYMFNLVFILRPNRHEVRHLVNTLHGNVMKTVNKAFKYAQQQSDFVWKESKRIQQLKDKAGQDMTPMSELWKEILKNHSLASCVKEIYDSLSQNRIGSVQLDTMTGPLPLSMHIPMPFYVADLPPESDETQRGLWLTTAHTYLPEDAHEDSEFLLKNSALLLLENEKKIISQLQPDANMATFVTLCKPTVSLYQMGQTNSRLSHNQIRKFAQHFVFWRRAMPVPPFHARDVYITSPNCDLSRLPQASQEWAKTFSLAPPLANFLANLSYAPQPYKHFCPSKKHRPDYFEMLAWLILGGWVTQLCTFAYVVVWPEIIYEVEYAMEAEELEKEKLAAEGHGIDGEVKLADATPGSASSTESSPPSSDAPPPTDAERIAEAARLERLNTKLQRAAADKATAHARKVVPRRTAHPSTNDSPHLAGLEPHIILDAKKATGEDSRYLSAIGERLADAGRDGDGARVAHAWQRFWRYFDGRFALERVALHEDMKRKEAWNLLTAMSEYLLCVRHW